VRLPRTGMLPGAILLMTALGCVTQPAGDQFVGPAFWPNPAPAAAVAQNAALDPQAAAAPFAVTPPALTGSWNQPVTATSVSPPESNAYLASWQRTLQSVKKSFEFQPETDPPADPLSLSTAPQHIGPNLHFRAAQVYESQGNTAMAVSFYTKALEIDPHDYSTLVALGRLHDRQGEFREAESLYQRAIASQPRNATALNDLGMCYARNGQLDLAIRQLEQAVAVQPLDPLYRNNLALLLVDAHRAEEALSHLAAAHGTAAAHYNLGFMLTQRQQYEPARQHFLAAVQSDPNLAPAHQMLARLESLASRR